MNVTEQICQHVVGTGYEDLDRETVSRVKIRLLDSIGVIATGIHGPQVDALFHLLMSYGETSQASAFFRNQMMSAPSAAMVNSFAMRSYDFEAIEAENPNEKSSAAHISGSTVPCALACAQRAKASGRDFIVALALGDDIAARLGAASGFDIYGGWDNTNTINGLGCTTIAGKLDKLSASQLNNAYGIDLNMLGGSMDNINYKTLAFKLPIALASRNAIFANDFAKTGMTATHDAFGGSKGYFTLFTGDSRRPELLLEGLGNTYYGDVVLKPWAACRATHPTIDAVLSIVEANSIDPKTIEQVKLHVSPRTAKGFVGKAWEMGEEPQVSAAFSIIYTAACALLFREVRPEHMDESIMLDASMLDMIGRIEILPTLDPDSYQTADAELILNDGRRYSGHCESPKGNIYSNPLTYEEILDKFYKNMSFAGNLCREQAAIIVELVDNLEHLDSINGLIQYLM